MRIFKNFLPFFINLDRRGNTSIFFLSLKVSAEKRSVRKLFAAYIRKQLTRAVPQKTCSALVFRIHEKMLIQKKDNMQLSVTLLNTGS